MYEATEILDFIVSPHQHEGAEGVIKCEVRYFYEPNVGMQVEPLKYKIDGAWVPMRAGVTTKQSDNLIVSIVQATITDETLDGIRDTDPAFEGMPFDDPVITQQEYQEMRV